MTIVGIGGLPEVGAGAAVGPGGEADLLTLPGHAVFGTAHEQADSYGFYIAGVNGCEVGIGHIQPAVYDVVTCITNTNLRPHVYHIGNHFMGTKLTATTNPLKHERSTPSGRLQVVNLSERNKNITSAIRIGETVRRVTPIRTTCSTSSFFDVARFHTIPSVVLYFQRTFVDT